jgi:hypothetical protein
LVIGLPRRSPIAVEGWFIPYRRIANPPQVNNLPHVADRRLAGFLQVA